jgi:RHS repeat-associated protein
VTTNLGFAGEYTDSESGLIYLRARYYDPTTGQFLSRDPLASITRQAYGYARGNPLGLTDPSGLSPGCAPAGYGDWSLDQKKDWAASQLGSDFEQSRRNPDQSGLKWGDLADSLVSTAKPYVTACITGGAQGAVVGAVNPLGSSLTGAGLGCLQSTSFAIEGALSHQEHAFAILDTSTTTGQLSYYSGERLTTYLATGFFR